MIQNMNELKITATTLFAALTALWGWFGWLTIFFVGCLILDYITGTMAACRSGEWSSKVARDGIWHKLGCIIAVLVAGLTDIGIKAILEMFPEIHLPFEYSVLICPMVMIWYMITELGSMVENAAKMGANIPPFLSKFLVALNDTVDAVGEKITGHEVLEEVNEDV